MSTIASIGFFSLILFLVSLLFSQAGNNKIRFVATIIMAVTGIIGHIAMIILTASLNIYTIACVVAYFIYVQILNNSLAHTGTEKITVWGKDFDKFPQRYNKKSFYVALVGTLTSLIPFIVYFATK